MVVQKNPQLPGRGRFAKLLDECQDDCSVLGCGRNGMEPKWLLNIELKPTEMWASHKAHISLHGDVNTQNSRTWVTSNPREYLSKPLHSSRVTIG
ncbi:hypothetical protein CDAR_81831 [Caerostris darwini]|uniref:Uncharacterized protein n=1 Tax=Caerostris darwini TaxID=1538125 RepID=A0AAV4V6T7_9ARAC|nr:hypothetical protein CDAR_81831 [Caerostris darwini]